MYSNQLWIALSYKYGEYSEQDVGFVRLEKQAQLVGWVSLLRTFIPPCCHGPALLCALNFK